MNKSNELQLAQDMARACQQELLQCQIDAACACNPFVLLVELVVANIALCLPVKSAR